MHTSISMVVVGKHILSHLFAHLPNSCKGIILVFYMFYEDHNVIMRHGIKVQNGTRAFILTYIQFVFNTIPTVFIDQFFKDVS